MRHVCNGYLRGLERPPVAQSAPIAESDGCPMSSRSDTSLLLQHSLSAIGQQLIPPSRLRRVHGTGASDCDEGDFKRIHHCDGSQPRAFAGLQNHGERVECCVWWFIVLSKYGTLLRASACTSHRRLIGSGGSKAPKTKSTRGEKSARVATRAAMNVAWRSADAPL